MTLRFLLLSRLTDKGHNYLIITNPIFCLIFMCTMWNTIFNFRATIFFWLPSSLSDLSFSAIYHFPPTNFWMKIFLNFYVLASVIFFSTLNSLVFQTHISDLTPYYTMNHFLHLNSICLMVQPASKRILTIHTFLCSYPFAVLSYIQLCWPK